MAGMAMSLAGMVWKLAPVGLRHVGKALRQTGRIMRLVRMALDWHCRPRSWLEYLKTG